eukprot:CAMPEP_0194276284 /NCGR_PEP_ID=MMETSP0169-20130528/8913_1 /TAXON_ID=218684 /ORGANISM="Corethron pennatum, Strain L29A3" /LENGTH=238 /DNA_ID=CAMNT_0039019971 /DNA_START=72 /DNA_END=785 /DNA_ORIENTATION=-
MSPHAPAEPHFITFTSESSFDSSLCTEIVPDESLADGGRGEVEGQCDKNMSSFAAAVAHARPSLMRHDPVRHGWTAAGPPADLTDPYTRALRRAASSGVDPEEDDPTAPSFLSAYLWGDYHRDAPPPAALDECGAVPGTVDYRPVDTSEVDDGDFVEMRRRRLLVLRDHVAAGTAPDTHRRGEPGGAASSWEPRPRSIRVKVSFPLDGGPEHAGGGGSRGSQVRHRETVDWDPSDPSA